MKRILLIAACFAVGAIASYATGGEVSLTSNARIIAMHVEAQSLREKHGLPKQELDESCCRIAQKWANVMAKRNSMFHGGGEQIIARGYPTVRKCFSGWMNSSGHRAWVLSRRELCGWGCQKSPSGQWFYAGVFRRKPKVVTSDKPQKPQPAATKTTESKGDCTNGTCNPRRGVLRWRR